MFDAIALSETGLNRDMNIAFYQLNDFYMYRMKIARVIPMHITGAKDEFNNCRPISQLLICSYNS